MGQASPRFTAVAAAAREILRGGLSSGWAVRGRSG
jgi:hypothetical protein